MDDIFFDKFCTKSLKQEKHLMLHGSNLQYLLGRRFDDEDVEDLINFLRDNKDVSCVNLASNNIHCHGFIDIIDYIAENDQIVELDARNNEIGLLGMKDLCENAPLLKLKILRLSGNKFGVEASKYAASLLSKNGSLEELHIANVDQTLTSLLHFTYVMRPDQRKFNDTLKTLDLSRPIPPYMHFFDSFHFATIVGSMLKVNKCLEKLYLKKYQFSCHDIEAILVDGKYNSTLKFLDLGCNNISDYGVACLCNWLGTKSTLTDLVLSHNIIQNGGARILSVTLPLSKIRHLDISHNNIGDDGIADILSTIMNKNVCIKDLRIFGNKIGTRTAEMLHELFENAILKQNNIDIKPYKIDGIFCYAYFSPDSTHLD